MQISLKWVNELVNIETVNLNELIEKLTLGGFEVEKVLELKLNNQTEIVLDISATTNRSDSLSIQGISYEIAALLDKPIKVGKYSIDYLDWKKSIKNSTSIISNSNNCSMFITMIIKNLNNCRVPKWLKNKLIRSGITPNNDLSDFQNYILLETGHPFEFYDLNKIQTLIKASDFKLTIESANENQEFLANNDINYKLDNSITIIKANEVPISIAGIITNKNVHYSNATTSLLIEGSIYNAKDIRQQSRSLGLRTDRSARYEKSIKSTGLLDSLYKLICLLRISNPDLICQCFTSQEKIKPAPQIIPLNYKTIKETLGPITTYNDYIPLDSVNNYLDRLRFSYTYNELKLIWNVEIPYLRSDDITQEIDLIEEIGRLHGFNNFISRLPKIKRIGKKDFSSQTREKIITSFLNIGLNELMHYSLVKNETFTVNEISILNPLSGDYSNLRSTLLPSLINILERNLKQGNSVIEGFEFGHIFYKDEQNNFIEKEYIAGMFGGINQKSKWSNSFEPLTWFQAKGKMEQFFQSLNLNLTWKNNFPSTLDIIYHPYCTAELLLDNKIKLGTFGQINPILAKKLTLPVNIYLFEFKFLEIQNQLKINKLKIYKNYSFYPKIIRDISVIVHENISFKKIKDLLYLNGTTFLLSIDLLDEYKSELIPKNHISFCFQLTFQSDKKTLENKEIETIIKNLQLLLVKKLNATIRI